MTHPRRRVIVPALAAAVVGAASFVVVHRDRLMPPAGAAARDRDSVYTVTRDGKLRLPDPGGPEEALRLETGGQAKHYFRRLAEVHERAGDPTPPEIVFVAESGADRGAVEAFMGEARGGRVPSRLPPRMSRTSSPPLDSEAMRAAAPGTSYE